jgi:hypothetical protein
MRKHIVASACGRNFNVAWLSFQPDDSISFGLNDRTYISPRFRANIGLWNAYNRVKITYISPSTPDALEPVLNPHFTFHPSVHFHLRADRDDEIFRAIADVDIVLEQEGTMPWIRAASAPLYRLRYGAPRPDSIATEEWLVPAGSDAVSIFVEVDFIRPSDVGKFDDMSRKSITWHNVGVRATAGVTWPQVATLSWFHSY